MSIPLKQLPEHEIMVMNILATYEQASKQDLAEGLAWYAEANELAQNLAAGTEYSVEQVAALIAVISPKLSWSKNSLYPSIIMNYHGSHKRDVSEWIAEDGKGMSVLHSRRELALRILDGDISPVLNGQKIESFFRSIMGDREAVAVDAWAVRIALDNPTLTDSPGKAAYERFVEAYRDAADRLGISPRDLQAATWVAYRNEHGFGRVR